MTVQTLFWIKGWIFFIFFMFIRLIEKIIVSCSPSCKYMLWPQQLSADSQLSLLDIINPNVMYSGSYLITKLFGAFTGAGFLTSLFFINGSILCHCIQGTVVLLFRLYLMMFVSIWCVLIVRWYSDATELKIMLCSFICICCEYLYIEISMFVNFQLHIIFVFYQ